VSAWTNREVKRLRRVYGHIPQPELIEQFPRHTFRSIVTMANRLKANRTGKRDWAAIAARHVPAVYFR
jgi:serine/threonine-protein kinase RIO1